SRPAGGIVGGARILGPGTRGVALGGPGLAERRQFPAHRLPRRRSLHEQLSGRRLDRPRLARASLVAAFAARLGGHPCAERRAAPLCGIAVNMGETDMNAGGNDTNGGAADMSVRGNGMGARGPGASGRRILFLDRDGTLNEETADEQIDSLEKVRLMPGVVPALLELKSAGFAFVMVTNQDGLGTPAFPRENFERAHRFIL